MKFKQYVMPRALFRKLGSADGTSFHSICSNNPGYSLFPITALKRELILYLGGCTLLTHILHSSTNKIENTICLMN